jgi:hypothetical protein
VHGILLRGIVYGVAHASSGAHALDFTGTVDADVAHVIAMFERAVNDVGDDFHLPMHVEREAAGGSHYVVVEHAPGTEIYLRGVLVVIERAMSVRAKPNCFSVIALIGTNRLNHGGPPKPRPHIV